MKDDETPRPQPTKNGVPQPPAAPLPPPLPPQEAQNPAEEQPEGAPPQGAFFSRLLPVLARFFRRAWVPLALLTVAAGLAVLFAVGVQAFTGLAPQAAAPLPAAEPLAEDAPAPAEEDDAPQPEDPEPIEVNPELLRADMEARVGQALQQEGTDIHFELVEQVLDAETIEQLAGDNFTRPEWEEPAAPGSGSLLVWGLFALPEDELPIEVPEGIGGEDLFSVVGLSPVEDSVDLLGAGRQALSVPASFFFSRMQQLSLYIRVSAVQLAVPYLSQLDYGLPRGCEATALAMMMSTALGQTDSPLDPQQVAADMVYSYTGSPADGYVGSPYGDGWTTYVEPQMDYVASVAGSAVNLTNYVYPGPPLTGAGQNRSSLARIRAHLAQGSPVVVWLRGYQHGPAPDYFGLGYTHVVVLTGYNETGFTLHDPCAIDAGWDYTDIHFESAQIYGWMAAHGFRAMSY